MSEVFGHEAIEECIRNHERILDKHEGRLNDHEKRIRTQESHSSVTDANVNHLCDRVNGLTKALWAVAAALAGAALTFFVTILQNKLL